MKIAICDDEQIILKQLSDYAVDFFSKKDTPVEVYTYTDGNVLLADSKSALFDALLLDIEMPNISGMEIADLVRAENEYVNIIFITNKDDLVYQSLKYTPLRFIRKSFLEDELEEALFSLVKKTEKKNIYREFTTENGRISLNISEIIYIEVYGHNLIIYLKDKKVETKGSLNKLEKEFSNMGFIRIHKCYLVNFLFIYAINTKDIVLDDKKILPLSRYKVNETKTKFQIFTRSV
jgi:DNA-binding LytR/AlgR family response regulator